MNNSDFEVQSISRADATSYCHARLIECGLTDWHVRLTTDMTKGFLGLCSHKDKAIILSAQHIDIHDVKMVKNTINHEIAHALTPGHSHDDIWKTKAKECGCYDTNPCSSLSFTPEAIDAIRSGALLKVEIEETVIRTPHYKVTRLQERCEQCGKVAVEKRTNELNGWKIIEFTCGHFLFKELPKATPFHELISADADPNCEHEWNHTFCTKCSAKKPFQFQIDGMKFIENALVTNKGAGIFDEMGLGKTIQSLGYLKYHPEKFPVLFIVKSGILFQFFKQSLIWLGDDYIGQVIRTSQEPVIPNLKCYFISYDLLIPKTRKNKKTSKIINQGFDIEKLIKRGIKTIVLDECQLVKNPDSSRTQQVRKLVTVAEHVIPLSGTPWKNRGSEFFTVLNMIAPFKFNSHQGFLNRWVEYYWDGNKYKEGGIRNVAAFKEYVKEIIIRREYNEVMHEYPEVNRTLYYTDLEGTNQEMYDEQVSDFVKWWNSKVIGGDEDSGGFGTENIMAKLARMRHILGLAKIPATLDFVDEYVEETDRKLVLFVHHIDVGQILYDKLSERYASEMPVLKLTSDLDAGKRFQLQEEFNAAPRAIMIASTLAAGEGINLQTCADAVLVERQWNPANEDQAAPGRFKRIGQLAKNINVTCITGFGTVDDILHGIVERKRAYFHKTMNKGDVPSWSVQDIMKEVAEGIVKQFNSKGKKVFDMVRK